MSFFPRLTTKLTPFSKNCSICPKIYTIWNVNFTKKWHFCPKYHRMKWYFDPNYQFSNKRNTLMKISTCTNKHFLRKIEVFIRIRQFLDVYRQSHKKSQFCSICPKIYTIWNVNFTKKWHFCPKYHRMKWYFESK